MMRYLIDHRGEIADISSASRRRTGYDVVASRTSIIHSGQVEWRNQHRRVELRFRPALVTAPAVRRIQSWLDRECAERVLLAYWVDNRWCHDILDSGRVAAHRFETLVVRYGGGNYGRALRRIKSPIGVERHHAFRQAVALWTCCGRAFSLCDHLPLFQNLMKGRATLLRAGIGDEFYLTCPGERLTFATRNWAARNVDVPVSNIPYYRDARPIFDGFTEARVTNVPISDEIDIFLTWPVLKPIRLSYHRLVLPLSNGTTRWVLSSTILDDDVKLLP